MPCLLAEFFFFISNIVLVVNVSIFLTKPQRAGHQVDSKNNIHLFQQRLEPYSLLPPLLKGLVLRIIAT